MSLENKNKLDWLFLCDQFLEHLHTERSLSKHTVEAYARDLSTFSHYFKTELKQDAVDLSHRHLENFIIHLSKCGYSQRSIRRMISGIKSFIHFLIKDLLLIKDDPSKNLSLPKLPKKLPQALDEVSVVKLLNSVKPIDAASLRDRSMLELMYSCGLRVSELVELSLSHVLIDEKLIKVFGKGSKERFIPVGDQAIEWLQQYLLHARPALLAEKTSQSVFVKNKGTSLTRQAVWHFIKKYSRLAGLSHIPHPHTFRHSFASHLIEGGADLRSVQKMLGHSSLGSTQIYTQISNEHVNKNYQAFHPRAKK